MDSQVLDTVEAVMAMRGYSRSCGRAGEKAGYGYADGYAEPAVEYADPAPAGVEEPLAGDVLVNIFRFLDMPSLGTAALVCTNWLAASNAEELWRDRAGAELRSLGENVRNVVQLLDIVSRKAFSERSSYERLEFLRGTVVLLQGYVTEQLEKSTWRAAPHQRFYYALLASIRRQTQETARMLSDLNTGAFAITVNFDIFDLSLRRYFEEISSLVPTVGQAHTGTAALVGDIEARQLWESVIGAGVCFTHWDVFYSRLVSRMWPEAASNERFARHLCHYVNFPRDNILTTYRFNVLLSLFGPFRHLASNFQKYVLCPGFLGLINMIKAEEILVQLLPQLRRSTVLLRFSRRQPEFLAFTSIDVRTGKVEHRRNVNREGRAVPIAQYLARAFPGYELVRMGVDDMATKIDTTFTFARYSNPYMYSEYPDRSSTSGASVSASSGGGFLSEAGRSLGTVQSSPFSGAVPRIQAHSVGGSLF